MQPRQHSKESQPRRREPRAVDDHEWDRTRWDPWAKKLRAPFDERDFERGSYSARYGFHGDPCEGAPDTSAPPACTRTDELILQDVCDRLAADPTVDATTIYVAVTSGKVVLCGDVATTEQKLVIAALAEAIRGVTEVIDAVRVCAD